MKNINLICLFYIFIFITSCNSSHTKSLYDLQKSDEYIDFILDENTKNFIQTLCLYKDKTQKEYLTFKNSIRNEILFYDMNSHELAFKIEPHVEGSNGVGFFIGYYIHNLDSIFIINEDIKEIALINRSSEVIDKLQYDYSKDSIPLRQYYGMTSYYNPVILIDGNIYIGSGCNRWIADEKNPVSIYINIKSKEVNTLPFSYPTLPDALNKAKRNGMEEHYSRSWDGTHFVYSWTLLEDVYITSQDHKKIIKRNIKSKYIPKIGILDDFGNVTLQQMCENPEYGNLLYDEFRDIYYRIAYPKTEIEKGVNPMELLQYGRKNFSIIILDKNFEIIGETLFPDYSYNSRLMFIRHDGLYISSSHPLNPEFSDDLLSFHRFDLVKK